MPNFDSREPNRGGILIILSQVEERSLSGRVDRLKSEKEANQSRSFARTIDHKVWGE